MDLASEEKETDYATEYMFETTESMSWGEDLLKGI